MAPPFVKSADRVLALLEHFRTTRAPASVGDLCRALDAPQSSVSMLLKSLVSLGYLDCAPGGRSYHPTYRVALLGEWLQARGPIAGPLSERLEALHRETGETVILGRQNGPHVQYLHIVQRDQGVLLRLQAGGLRPMATAAVGLILLAQLPDREARAVIRRNNADAAGPELRVPEAEVFEDLRRFRLQGYAESRGLLTPGASVVAVALAAGQDGERLAIGIGGPSNRIDHRRAALVEALRACAMPASPV